MQMTTATTAATWAQNENFDEAFDVRRCRWLSHPLTMLHSSPFPPRRRTQSPGPRAHSPYGTQSRIINIGEQSKPTKMTGWPGQTEAAEVVVTSMATKHFRCHSILPRTKGCCLPVIFLKSGHSEKERLPNKQGWKQQHQLDFEARQTSSVECLNTIPFIFI